MTATRVNSGTTIDYTPTSAVAAGGVVVSNSLVGIATADIPANTKGALAVMGVFDVPKLSTDNVGLGAVLYWDAANSRATLTSSGNTRMGLAVEAAGNGVGRVKVLLNV
jgi:predicted RecA/RadA family phage recombinase